MSALLEARRLEQFIPKGTKLQSDRGDEDRCPVCEKAKGVIYIDGRLICRRCAK